MGVEQVAEGLEEELGIRMGETTTDGRFTLGIGTSGAQVVEGWHGESYRMPLTRSREYVAIVRKIFERQEKLTYDGDLYQIPYMGEGSTGQGKPLKSMIHGRADIPVYTGSMAPKSQQMSGELEAVLQTVVDVSGAEQQKGEHHHRVEVDLASAAVGGPGTGQPRQANCQCNGQVHDQAAHLQVPPGGGEKWRGGEKYNETGYQQAGGGGEGVGQNGLEPLALELALGLAPGVFAPGPGLLLPPGLPGTALGGGGGRIAARSRAGRRPVVAAPPRAG